MTGTYWLDGLHRIRRRVDAADRGPWRAIAGGVIAPPALDGSHSGIDDLRHYGGILVGESMTIGNAQFIAAARTDIEVLLGTVEVLNRYADELEGAFTAAIAKLSDAEFELLRSHVPVSVQQLLARRDAVAADGVVDAEVLA